MGGIRPPRSPGHTSINQMNWISLLIVITINVITICICVYTLWKIRFIASNTVDNRKDIRSLHEHDKQLLSYVKQLNGEFQNAKKAWSKTDKRSKQD